jgi:hypothetical protein
VSRASRSARPASRRNRCCRRQMRRTCLHGQTPPLRGRDPSRAGWGVLVLSLARRERGERKERKSSPGQASTMEGGQRAYSIDVEMGTHKASRVRGKEEVQEGQFSGFLGGTDQDATGGEVDGGRTPQAQVNLSFPSLTTPQERPAAAQSPAPSFNRALGVQLKGAIPLGQCTKEWELGKLRRPRAPTSQVSHCWNLAHLQDALVVEAV